MNTTFFRRVLCLSVAALGTSLLTGAALAAPDTAKPQATGELEEFVVKADHLWQLRKAIVETEDKFYERYNQLNTIPDFNVYCENSAPLGTRIQKRGCKISFYIDAEAEQAQAFLHGEFMLDPELVWLERRDEYRKNALQVINSDRELRKLIRQREKLEKLYFAKQKEVFKNRWIAW